MTRQKLLRVVARAVVLVVLGGAIMVLVFQMSKLSGRITVQQDRLSASLKSQTRNRTSNVAKWCGAINADRRALDAYVKRVHAPSLNLVLLPCGQLERATLASTHPK